MMWASERAFRQLPNTPGRIDLPVQVTLPFSSTGCDCVSIPHLHPPTLRFDHYTTTTPYKKHPGKEAKPP